ncbi:MAG: sigma-54 dependent transcriptional regulator [Candidatus Zixiibacteriota bacterium]|jgi:two-component system NtrC family response regulator
MSIKILLADDDPALRRVIQFKLKQKGYDVDVAEDGQQALDRLKATHYDLLLSDMKMPKLSGIELLEMSKNVQPELEVILITAYATVSQAVEAVKLGAFDYLTKPFEDEELFVAIDKALKFKRLEEENRALRGRLRGQDFLDTIVGISPSFKRLMDMVDKIAPTDATVLLTGESGTGKEVIARAIHYKSLRAERDFVAVNCAAIPRELIESELFGHMKGAFTGAVRDKKGKFELADGGTLLLDEISELPIELQAKLLRVIQEKVIEPLGAERKVEVDVRLLAATNIDLKERVRRGEFREDLFYRLNVIPLHIPSLRERVEDIPILVNAFLRKYDRSQEIKVDAKLMETLEQHPWPGNIRELENLIERMVILRRSNKLTVDDLPDDFGTADRTGSPRRDRENLTFHEAEKQLVLDALEKHDWNRSQAAKYLKIPRHVLIYRMKKYGISPETMSNS